MPEQIYKPRDKEALGDHYFRHLEAMTSESLHSKADVAAELAFRDGRIAELEEEREGAITRESILRSDLAIKSRDFDGYAAAARVIALHLKDFCDDSLTYDEMIAAASREASARIAELEANIEQAIDLLAAKCPEVLESLRTLEKYQLTCLAEPGEERDDSVMKLALHMTRKSIEGFGEIQALHSSKS